jgi:hypothetical protein
VLADEDGVHELLNGFTKSCLQYFVSHKSAASNLITNGIENFGLMTTSFIISINLSHAVSVCLPLEMLVMF